MSSHEAPGVAHTASTIEFDAVTKRYPALAGGRRDAPPAVESFSTHVPAGTVTGLVGSNGAGKTTLLLMLAALLAPDAGSIRVAGLDPTTQPRQVHQAIGWMPDSFGT